MTTREAWNDENPVGTRVRAWPGTRDAEPLLTRTRSAAWALGDGTPVVAVEGYAGGIALTHVEPISDYDDQPEGIDECSTELPSLSGAARRVGEYLSCFGDGVIDLLSEDGVAVAPLFARDLEALCQHALRPTRRA